jgi:hypothetical protein
VVVATYTKILLKTIKKKQLEIRPCCSICGKKIKFTISITTSQFPLSCWQCMIINTDTWKYAYAWSHLLTSLVVDAIMIAIWYQARNRSRCNWYLIIIGNSLSLPKPTKCRYPSRWCSYNIHWILFSSRPSSRPLDTDFVPLDSNPGYIYVEKNKYKEGDQ